MRRMIGAIGLAMTVMLAFPAVAPAAEEGASESSGGGTNRLYGTLGAIWSNAAFDIPATANSQNSWGLDTRVGYQFHGNLAAEVQYQWGARYEITQGGAQLQTIETHAATANLKAGLLESAFQPYLLFGMGIVNAQLRPGNDATDFGLRVGGGVQVFVTEHVGFYGELGYLKAFGSLRDLDAVPIAFGAAVRY
jgi:opacity protein-like surface antigen